jgi:cyclophilin family peptidyl-prolyl cis-trans isomerase
VNASGRPRQPQGGTLRQQFDQAFPPFTARRYVAIWVPFMLLLVAIMVVLVQCNGGSTPVPATPTPAPTTAASTPAAGAVDTGKGKYFVVETDKGKIVAKLYTQESANVSKTIANFEKKANAGEFNGRVFHRVEDWVIQGGDPLGNGTGGGDMPSEYNNIPFKAGALGVARGPDPKINNDSQFFYLKSDADALNGQYTNFGQVVEGMDVVNKIAIGDKMNKVYVEER